MKYDSEAEVTAGKLADKDSTIQNQAAEVGHSFRTHSFCADLILRAVFTCYHYHQVSRLLHEVHFVGSDSQ